MVGLAVVLCVRFRWGISSVGHCEFWWFTFRFVVLVPMWFELCDCCSRLCVCFCLLFVACFGLVDLVFRLGTC